MSDNIHHTASDSGVSSSVPSGSDSSQPVVRKPGKHSPEGIRNVLSTISIIVMAPLIALCLTAFFFQSYQVDGPSMETTLQNGDRLIVLKLYKTWGKVTHHAYLPHRGDVIVFEEGNFQGLTQGEPKQLIKRVIGLPGDHIIINNDVVTIYNHTHPGGFDPDKTMAYGKVLPTTTGNVDITIPRDQIFVMGDNRTNSLDSRVFGTVPVQNIIGKLVLRVLPLDKAQTF